MSAGCVKKRVNQMARGTVALGEANKVTFSPCTNIQGDMTIRSAIWTFKENPATATRNALSPSSCHILVCDHSLYPVRWMSLVFLVWRRSWRLIIVSFQQKKKKTDSFSSPIVTETPLSGWKKPWELARALGHGAEERLAFGDQHLESGG